MTWTHFWDMHSGGGTKEGSYEHIYIEASEDEAVAVFYNRFGHDPNRVSCTCCGEDYSISEYSSLDEATHYQRQNRFSSKKPETLEEYVKNSYVLVIGASEINDNERTSYIPRSGWVWAD